MLASTHPRMSGETGETAETHSFRADHLAALETTWTTWRAGRGYDRHTLVRAPPLVREPGTDSERTLAPLVVVRAVAEAQALKTG